MRERLISARLGKVVSVNGSFAAVEYFHSPIDDPFVVTLNTSSLHKVELAPQNVCILVRYSTPCLARRPNTRRRIR